MCTPIEVVGTSREMSAELTTKSPRPVSNRNSNGDRHRISIAEFLVLFAAKFTGDFSSQLI